jgi:hypothetical protein
MGRPMPDPMFERPRPVGSVDEPRPTPPELVGKGKQEIADRFVKTLQEAHSWNKALAFHVVQAMTSPDPAKRAEHVDQAIRLGEGMLDEFRKAREMLPFAAPRAKIPLPPSAVASASKPEPIRPKRF